MMGVRSAGIVTRGWPARTGADMEIHNTHSALYGDAVAGANVVVRVTGNDAGNCASGAEWVRVAMTGTQRPSLPTLGCGSRLAIPKERSRPGMIGTGSLSCGTCSHGILRVRRSFDSDMIKSSHCHRGVPSIISPRSTCPSSHINNLTTSDLYPYGTELGNPVCNADFNL
jgi:hypothetical protein